MEDTDQKLRLIKRTRYLIPCTCTICNKQFKDIIFGESHVYEQHKDRKKSNVIESLEWNIEKDNKSWKTLKEIEEKRNKILRDLNDDDTLIAATVPKIFSIGKEALNLKKIVEGSVKIDKAKQDKLIDKLKNKISKFLNNLIGENYLIGEEVLAPTNKRKISRLGNDLNEILGLKKAYLLLTNSGLKKQIEQIEEQEEEEPEEEEIEEEMELEE